MVERLDDRFPASVRVTGYGWDDSRSSYKIQIGTSERTLAYSWVPAGNKPDDLVIADAWEIAKRLIEGWNSRARSNPLAGGL